jgi:hypothetical protein
VDFEHFGGFGHFVTIRFWAWAVPVAYRLHGLLEAGVAVLAARSANWAGATPQERSATFGLTA